MNLTYQTVMRSSYKPGKILLNARWKRTSPKGRRILIESEAFQARHEVRRCYWSAVITFSGFPEHWIRTIPPTQAFLGELVFHPSPQTPAQPKTTFLSQA